METLDFRRWTIDVGHGGVSAWFFDTHNTSPTSNVQQSNRLFDHLQSLYLPISFDAKQVEA